MLNRGLQSVRGPGKRPYTAVKISFLFVLFDVAKGSFVFAKKLNGFLNQCVHSKRIRHTSPRRRCSSCNTDCATGAKLGGKAHAGAVNTLLTQLCEERRQAEAVHAQPRRNRQCSATNYCRSRLWSPDCVEDDVATIS